MKKAYVLLFDTYADWEIGYVLAELRRIGNLQVVTVGFTTEPVLSMGGLRVQPEMLLADVDIDDVLLFILPGGMMWENAYPKQEIHTFLQALDSKQVPMAGICAASTVLAKAGVLQGKKHTSNSLKYLQDNAPGTTSQEDYIAELAVTDGHITTASGLGSIEFTLKIMEALDITTPEMRALWHRAFKHGEYPEDLA
ncbi:MAG: thiamine biosynthesis protein ThiJ [Desulfovibrio sp.]|nr:MAG: thiamine biosynthesis protein ThiJ [Desulfovibrio sp.]